MTYLNPIQFDIDSCSQGCYKRFMKLLILARNYWIMRFFLSGLLEKTILGGLRSRRTVNLQPIAGLVALLIFFTGNAAAQERPVAEKPGETTQPSAASSTAKLTREEEDRERKEAAARKISDQFRADLEEGKGNAPTAPVSKPKSKAPSRRSVSPGSSTPHDYAGFIGDASINLTMTVYKGEVSGDFYFLRAPKTLYTFSGSNAKEGFLKFEIASGGTPFADAQLKKDPRVGNSILWDGLLQTKDKKQSLRFFLTRPLKPDAATDWPTSLEEFDKLKGFARYEGSIIDARGRKAIAVFKLRFNGIKCDGFYYQVYSSGRPSFIFRLQGQNPTGLLTLREFDDDGMSAELFLKKTLAAKVVSWHGHMTNHRSKQAVKRVEFHRTL